jgi:hypothetical protein
MSRDITPSCIIRGVPFPFIEPESQVLDFGLMAAGVGIRDCVVLGYPAVGEVIGIFDLPALVVYLDGKRMFIFREQGTFARCRAITPYHGDPLFKSKIKGNSLFKVDKIRGPLAFRSYGRRRVSALQVTGTFHSHWEGKDLREAGSIPAAPF